MELSIDLYHVSILKQYFYLFKKMCTKLITAPVGYVIRVYINDYSIADVNRTTEKCDNEYLVLNSGESVRTYCGVRTKNGNNVFESSSNELLIHIKKFNIFLIFSCYWK